MLWKGRKSVNQLAEGFGRSGRVDRLEEGLQQIAGHGLTDEEREAWHHMWGIAAFRANNRAEAMRRFQKAFEAVPTSPKIAFSLAQEYEHIGESERAFALFDRFKFPALPAPYALAQARYAYLWNDLTRGLDYVRPIFEAYFQLRIADDHFLYVRGLPFLGQAWAYIAAFLELRCEIDALAEFTATVKSRLLEYDFECIDLYVASIRSKDFVALARFLLHRATEQRKSGASAAYLEMRAATTQALALGSKSGRTALTSVTVAQNDFPWLEDVRTAALAALTLAEGDQRSAEALTNRFLGRQPLLFEPDHAFNFRLLSYHETLKPAYQTQCRRRQIEIADNRPR